ncbi:MAG TPA: acyl-CoA dehydrogenase family protein, partial [Myxococcota bacterium]|nr:acyl-CoA dehydrogenase family protein [Myxococcota bacterium]
MDFRLSPQEEAFRDEVRRFLDENLPADASRADFRFLVDWNRKVRAKGWVGFSWPKEVGGGGGSLMEQVVLKEEMSKRKAPPLGSCFMGLAWVGPAIIQYGTEEQKRRFVPDILDGAYQWCTGYSEPATGSDLAALQCRGVREGDVYVVNGQKIWTSIAMWSKWMILLVRTDPGSGSKHEGITCLLVEMSTPGIEVRPIQNMSGSAMFAEVFLNDVRVP